MRSDLTLDQVLARIRRWWYLLTVGMRRGEMAIDLYSRYPDGREELRVLGSGREIEKGVRKDYRIWWEKKR